jgi:delta24(24(1))-sterol reductase
MIWSHYILLYFWYCLETNDGKMVIWDNLGQVTDSSWYMGHANGMRDLVLTKGVPSNGTWIIYLAFFVAQIVFAYIMPGICIYGLPTAPDGKRLPYHCNGYICFYATLAAFIAGDYYGTFSMSSLAERYGEFLMASIIIGDVTSLYWYFYGLILNDEHNGGSNVTGNPFYDFFMGTILYPRMW